MTPVVMYEKKGAVGLITLNRPERRNAITQQLLTELFDCVEKGDNDNDVGALVLCGQGTSFCSGIDLDCLATDNLVNPRGDGKDMVDVFQECATPVIGAVSGYAVTGGFELALNCDFLIADDTAYFMDTHAKIGIHPGWGMTQLLQQAVGRRRALQISLTCEKVPAEKAFGWGLVNEVVPREALLTRALELAESIASVNRAMMHTVKTFIEVQSGAHVDEGLAREKSAFKTFASKALKC
ncbi:enoyl-CoA hydratase-related protein [Desulfoluna butyratoxydans]|uniref:Crotonase superfamily n=1 Tax=Desulfoluna butyratoxydans TaxID=231438 RepID=A0A4U8YLM6_9BACT|nr:enoyl-CoA hydratase-related protein [Desulfoluna butyratoxydans]VFQ44477.1 crotonase superfamily [Desulfoluna butyratoxydans]